jgi:hypothetical protein
MNIVDWKTILTSVFSSSLIAAAICYLIKTSFDRSLEVLVDKLKEENKAAISEASKKKSFVFEKQYEPYQLMVSRAYSLRCAARKLYNSTSDISDEKFNNLVNDFRVEHKKLFEGMTEARAIFTPVFWSLVHDFKSVASGMILYMTFIQKRREQNRVDEAVKETWNKLAKDYSRIENGYIQIVVEAQVTLGVTGISVSNK